MDMVRRGPGFVFLALLLLAGPPPATADDDGVTEIAPDLRFRAWQESGPPDRCVDVLFVGDGYQRSHLGRSGKYWRDVNRYARQLFKEPPFTWCQDKFNVRALFLESKDAGCIGAKPGESPSTALKSKFRGRFLGFGDAEMLQRLVDASGDVDIVLVMVNTEKYGGGGTTLGNVQRRGRPLPAPTFSARDTTSFCIAVHELGHSFADLADEYVEEGKDDRWPLPTDGTDLKAANVALASHIDPTSFDTVATTAKWKHFLTQRGANRWTWAYEGGHYRSRGVYRPFPRCRMNKLADPFCPVCCEALAKAVFETCGVTWDDDAFHKAHPLRLWR